ncbi:putative glutamate receptor [Nymphon striatum]|nr:putative glutamate receptor [Nymphon striatum]
MNERFASDSTSTISALFNLLPSVIIKIDISELPKLVNGLETYRDYLPRIKSLRTELEVCRAKWLNIASPADSLLEALRSCSQELFPNLVVVLQIACVIPVTSCEAEMSFSATSSVKIFGKIGEPYKLTTEGLVSTSEDGVKAVLSGNWVFLKEKSYLEFKIEEDLEKTKACNMILAPEEFFKTGYGLALPKNSPLRKYFDLQILKLYETGLLKRWKDLHWPENSVCTLKRIEERARKSLRPLKFDDMYSGFILWTVGLFFSAVIYVTECLQKAWHPPKMGWLWDGAYAQYSSSLSAAESSTLMTTDDGTMSSSSTSNNYGVVLLQV